MLAPPLRWTLGRRLTVQLGRGAPGEEQAPSDLGPDRLPRADAADAPAAARPRASRIRRLRKCRRGKRRGEPRLSQAPCALALLADTERAGHPREATPPGRRRRRPRASTALDVRRGARAAAGVDLGIEPAELQQSIAADHDGQRRRPPGAGTADGGGRRTPAAAQAVRGTPAGLPAPGRRVRRPVRPAGGRARRVGATSGMTKATNDRLPWRPGASTPPGRRPVPGQDHQRRRPRAAAATSSGRVRPRECDGHVGDRPLRIRHRPPAQGGPQASPSSRFSSWSATSGCHWASLGRRSHQLAARRPPRSGTPGPGGGRLVGLDLDDPRHLGGRAAACSAKPVAPAHRRRRGRTGGPTTGVPWALEDRQQGRPRGPHGRAAAPEREEPVELGAGAPAAAEVSCGPDHPIFAVLADEEGVAGALP